MSIPVKNKFMPIYLNAVGALAKDASIKTLLNYQHIADGEVQVVLAELEGVLGTHLIKSLFVPSDLDWTRITLNISKSVKVQFDEVEFDAVLKTIQVRKEVSKKGTVKFYYTFLVEKDPDELDLQLAMYVKQKEVSENGTQRLIAYDINFEFTKE